MQSKGLDRYGTIGGEGDAQCVGRGSFAFALAGVDWFGVPRH